MKLEIHFIPFNINKRLKMLEMSILSEIMIIMMICASISADLLLKGIAKIIGKYSNIVVLKKKDNNLIKA